MSTRTSVVGRSKTSILPVIRAAAVLLAEGFEEIETATPVDVLRRAGVEVTLAGVDGLVHKGAHGLTYNADAKAEGLAGDFDLVVLPGGMPGAKNLGESPDARSLVERTFRAGKLIAAICAAPALTLAAWGILDGKLATCYPGMEKTFPAGVKFSPERVVVDGNVVTSRGPGAALEFSLTLVRLLVGEDQAKRIAVDMLLK